MILFFISLLIIFLCVCGIALNKKNLLIILLWIEIMLISIILIFCLNYFIQKSQIGNIYGLFILTIAAVESAIVISLLVQFYRLKGNISINIINKQIKNKF